MLVNPLQIRSFPAEARTVIHKFAVNFPCGKIYKRHNFLGLAQLITYSIAPVPGQRAPSYRASQLTTRRASRAGPLGRLHWAIGRTLSGAAFYFVGQAGSSSKLCSYCSCRFPGGTSDS